MACQKWIAHYQKASSTIQQEQIPRLEDYQDLIECYQVNYQPSNKTAAAEKTKQLIAQALKLYAQEKQYHVA